MNANDKRKLILSALASKTHFSTISLPAEDDGEETSVEVYCKLFTYSELREIDKTADLHEEKRKRQVEKEGGDIEAIDMKNIFESPLYYSLILMMHEGLFIEPKDEKDKKLFQSTSEVKSWLESQRASTWAKIKKLIQDQQGIEDSEGK